jgi:hypothetical protein
MVRDEKFTLSERSESNGNPSRVTPLSGMISPLSGLTTCGINITLIELIMLFISQLVNASILLYIIDFVDYGPLTSVLLYS